MRIPFQELNDPPALNLESLLLLARKPEVARFLQALDHNKLILVSGPRWVGKTSFIRATLDPKPHYACTYIDVWQGSVASQLLPAATSQTIQSHSQKRILILDSMETAIDHRNEGDLPEVLSISLDASVYDSIVMVCRSECMGIMGRHHPSWNKLISSAATIAIRPLNQHRIRCLLHEFVHVHSLTLGDSMIDMLADDLKRVSVDRGGGGVTLAPLLALLMQSLVRSTLDHNRIGQLRLYQEQGGLEGLASQCINQHLRHHPELSWEDALALINAMSPAYQAGSRCQIHRGSVEWREVSHLQEFVSAQDAATAAGGFFMRTGDRVTLREDALLALWPDALSLLDPPTLRSSPVHHLAEFYFRTGQIVSRCEPRILRQYPCQSAGEREFLKLVIRSSRRQRVARAISTILVVAVAMLLASLSFALSEYRESHNLLEQEAIELRAGSRDDSDEHMMNRIDGIMHDMAASIEDSRVRARSPRTLLATAMLFEEILRRQQLPPPVARALQSRVEGDATSARGSCKAAAPHYRKAIDDLLPGFLDDATSRHFGFLHYTYFQLAACVAREAGPTNALGVVTEYLEILGKMDVLDVENQALHDKHTAEAMILRGDLLYELGDNENAAFAFEASLPLLEHERTLSVKLKLANMHMLTGELTLAQDHLESVRKTLEEDVAVVSDRVRNRLLRNCLGQLAALNALVGKYDESRAALERELHLAWQYFRHWDESYEFRRTVASLYLKLGELELAARDWDNARTRLQQGASLILELKDLHEVFDDSRSSARLSLDLGLFMGAFGDLALEVGGPAEAMTYYRRALDLNEGAAAGSIGQEEINDALAISLSRLAWCQVLLLDFASAVDLYRRESAVLRELLAQKAEDFSLKIRLGVALARIVDGYHALGKTEEAARALQDAVDLLQDLPGQAFLGGVIDDHIEMQALRQHIEYLRSLSRVELRGLEQEHM